MASESLMENAVALIESQIKSNIASSLSNVRQYWNDAYVQTPVPSNESYFIAPHFNVYRAPGIFIVGESINFRLSEKGSNFINAIMRINVSVVVEDRDVTHLTVKAWRYQTALHQILANQRLTTSDNTVRIIVKVTGADFKEIYTDAQKAGDSAWMYRKEVSLSCEVEHYETLSP